LDYLDLGIRALEKPFEIPGTVRIHRFPLPFHHPRWAIGVNGPQPVSVHAHALHHLARTLLSICVHGPESESVRLSVRASTSNRAPVAASYVRKT